MTGLLTRVQQLRLAQSLIGITMALDVGRNRLAHAGAATLAELACNAVQPLFELGLQPHTDHHDPGVQQFVEHLMRLRAN